MMLSAYVMIICTQSGGLCGQIIRVEFETLEECKTERQWQLESFGRENFKYILCEKLVNDDE